MLTKTARKPPAKKSLKIEAPLRFLSGYDATAALEFIALIDLIEYLEMELGTDGKLGRCIPEEARCVASRDLNRLWHNLSEFRPILSQRAALEILQGKL